MDFLYSPILWGALAVTAPVVIHLLLRPKPRTKSLPTLRFLRKIQKENVSKLKLKHWLLLALRMLAILLIVFLLARAFLMGRSVTSGHATPSAMVVVIDTSASMGYRHQGRTVLQRGQQIAAEIVESLPTGSVVGVLTTSGQANPTSLFKNIKLAAQHVRDAPLGQDDTPLAPSLALAASLLKHRPEANREIVIVSDRTKQGWRGMEPLASGGAWTATVIDCGVARDANIAVGPVRVEAGAVPRGATVRLRSSLGSEHLGGAMRLQLAVDGRAVEQRSVDLRAGQRLPLTFHVRADHAGVLLGTLRLRNDDPLRADNVRFFTVDVLPAAKVLLVGATVVNDRTAFLMGNAIAPPMPGRAGALQRETIDPRELNRQTLRKTPLVVLANTSALTATQWTELEAYCRAGHSVWIVTGESLVTASYNTPAAQRVMPVLLGRLEILDPPIALGTPEASLPMLQPFAPGTGANPPLRDVQSRRRFSVDSVATDAKIALTYADGVPAIVTRTLDTGHVVFWNLSPARDWSNLARLGGQFVVLAQRTARLLMGNGTGRRQFAPDQMIELPLPGEFRRPAATLQGQDTRQASPVQFVLTRPPHRKIRLAPQRVGNYKLTLREGTRIASVGFSVNTPAGESNLRQRTPNELESLFPDGVSRITAAQQRIARPGQARKRLDLTAPIFLVLLLVLLVEAFLSNRFYRTPDETPEE